MARIFSVHGSIFIDNEAANKSIDETTQKADKSGKSMGASFKSIVGGIGKAAAAVGSGTLAIGASLYGMANKTASAADAIDKGSQKVGFSAEAYQKWDYVLGQNGDSIDSLTTYVTKLTNNLDDAANGSETANEKFARLGLSVDELKQMSREDMFDAVVKALANVEDESERAALANDLLGNKSAALAAMLNSGSEAIDGLKDRAVELGMVMSDDTVKAGVVMGDTITFTCKPWRYSYAGQKTVKLTAATTLTNFEKFPALPYIKIYGSGAVTLSVNGKAFPISAVNEYVEIDSETLNTHKGTENKNTTASSLEYPTLNPGANTISWTGNVSAVHITPRWRTL